MPERCQVGLVGWMVSGVFFPVSDGHIRCHLSSLPSGTVTPTSGGAPVWDSSTFNSSDLVVKTCQNVGGEVVIYVAQFCLEWMDMVYLQRKGR